MNQLRKMKKHILFLNFSNSILTDQFSSDRFTTVISTFLLICISESSKDFVLKLISKTHEFSAEFILITFN